MGCDSGIDAMLAVCVMNHELSTIERSNREFASWDFRGKPTPWLVNAKTKQNPQSICSH